jgi:probable HAF family extracellular repeat protein
MRRFIIVSMLAISSAMPARAITYAITDLGSIQLNQASRATGLNGHGAVVGDTYVLTQGAYHLRAFSVQDGLMLDLGTFGGLDSRAYAINSQGHVVGGATTDRGAVRAFLDRGRGLEDLGTLGGMESTALGINHAGQVVGWADSSDGQQRAFLYQDGNMIDLGTLGGLAAMALAVNEGGHAVGRSADAQGYARAFLYADGSLSDLGTLGGTQSTAADINGRDEITGYSSLTDGTFRGFLYSNGLMQDLGQLAGRPVCYGTGLNDRTEVVGYCHNEAHERFAAFIHRNGQMHNLNHLLEPVSGAGWDLRVARGINRAGQIIGTGWHDAQGTLRAFLLTPIKH